jgi:predicted porin
MNKKLIALAVAGACVAPAAMAQTANPVTLYGIVYVTVESVEAKGGSAPVSRRTRVEDQASRLGVRGTEDLGGGLKAFFQLETAFRPDSNNTTFAARNSGVGLQGGWGSILLGRWDMPFKSATGAIDPFGDVTIGGFNATLQSTRSSPATFDRREENVVQYWSPSWGGFAFKGAISANEAKGCTTAGTPAVTTCLDPQDWGASATWTRGPVYLFYAYEEHKDVSASVSKEDANALGGSFAFGAFKLGGQYQEIKKTGTTKIKNWMANMVWTLGNNQIILNYMNSKDGGANGAATQPDCDNASIGWQYNFTRRTWFLAQYTKIDNNEAAACNFGSQRLALSAGQDPQGISFGLRHAF